MLMCVCDFEKSTLRKSKMMHNCIIIINTCNLSNLSLTKFVIINNCTFRIKLNCVVKSRKKQNRTPDRMISL